MTVCLRWWCVALALLASYSPALAQGVATDPLREQQDLAVAFDLLGDWEVALGEQVVAVSFHPDGSLRLNERTGRFTVSGGQLLVSYSDDPDQTFTYNYKLVGNTLELAGGSLSQPLVFTRQLAITRTLGDLFDISPGAMTRRFKRIGVIVAIVLASHLIIALAQFLSRVLIFSEFGPLRWLFQSHKNRAKTVHALVLNLLKYFIYFTALGMILTELGVNYATYLASLSVIGLAIGFGSQGLVQDMVTGFFIIFEGQFDVGDMVEVSGQTGVVVELGLRMTKIRNYFGQIVVIPNRNIAVVGNFSRGAQRAYIDVPITSPAAALAALELLDTIGQEIKRQYDGVVLDPVRATGPVSLRTGEHFVRLHLSLWPGQTWVIDQQLIPRIKERFKTASIEVPAERVTVHYHARPQEIRRFWQGRLPWPTRSRQSVPPATAEPDAGHKNDI
jgi:small-conductance mechanosensitive channel